MATIAPKHQQQASTAPPISAHPAFPAIVALWFAALLGFGSLILPVVLLEKLILATGLSAILPAAAPPLGFTAKALIALAASVAGAIVGVYLARMVARAHRTEAEPRRRLPVKSACPTDSANGADPAAPMRRRLLALGDDAMPARDTAEDRPMPAQDDFRWMDSPLSQDHLFADEGYDYADEATQSDDKGKDELPALDPIGIIDEFDDPEDTAPLEHVFTPAAMPIAETPSQPVPSTRAELADLGLAQLVERLGGALAAYRTHLQERAARQARFAAPGLLGDTAGDRDIAPAHEAAQARAAYFRQQPAEAALGEKAQAPVHAAADPAPVTFTPDSAEDAEFEEEYVDEAAVDASFSLPIGRLTPLWGSADRDEEAGDANGGDDSADPYASLLPHDLYDEEGDDFWAEDAVTPPFPGPDLADVELSAFDGDGNGDGPEADSEPRETAPALWLAASGERQDIRRPPGADPAPLPHPLDQQRGVQGGDNTTGPIRSPEADEALRTALAALQRINGAA